jgi:hypothetical protein
VVDNQTSGSGVRAGERFLDAHLGYFLCLSGLMALMVLGFEAPPHLRRRIIEGVARPPYSRS